MQQKLRKWLKGAIPKRFHKDALALQESSADLLYKVKPIGPKLRQKRMRSLASVPQQLNIEVTSLCNAKCIMCPRLDMRRKMRIMDKEMFESIVSQGRDLGVENYCLNGYGEIFTARKHYKYFISHIREQVPHARIIINTNGSLMDQKAAQYLIDMNVYSINVDIDGATGDVQKVRPGLIFEDVVANTKRLVELRNAAGKQHPKVRVGIIVQDENKHEVDAHREMWAGIADYGSPEPLVSRGGDIKVDWQVLGHPCYLLWSEMNIWTDGHVSLCCDDWDAKAVMGDIKKQSISEIWNGPEFTRYREAHIDNKAGEMAVCQGCNFSRPGPRWFKAG